MKPMWCWRCRTEVPMLDSAEFALIQKLYHDAMRALKSAEPAEAPVSADVIYARLAPVRDAYRAMTGHDEQNAAAIIHHHVELYGPPCQACSKPLRAPQAKYCAACGASA